MHTLHEKSPCCRDKVRRYGARRRQCAKCDHTWRVWQRKRGRRRRRRHPRAFVQYVSRAAPPVYIAAQQRGVPRTTAQRHLIESRDTFATHTAWPAIPKGPLIAVADAWVRYLEGSWHCWYAILVRAVDGDEAVLTPVTYVQGRETITGWKQAFDALRSSVTARIAALVCDGHRGLVFEARWRHWHLQRCHFHLIAAIQGRRSRWGTSRHQQEGERLYALVRTLLITRDPTVRTDRINELEVFGWDTHSPQLKKIIQGFLNNLDDYRTYLEYPGLHLPRTSNTVEVFFSFVEELCHRAHGFATPHALHQWIVALAKYKAKIKCNGYQPNL